MKASQLKLTWAISQEINFLALVQNLSLSNRASKLLPSVTTIAVKLKVAMIQATEHLYTET